MTALYSNLFRITTGPEEVVMDFGSFFPVEGASKGVPEESDFHTRIIFGVKILDHMIPALEQARKNSETVRLKALDVPKTVSGQPS
jgi:hypothetical protein